MNLLTKLASSEHPLLDGALLLAAAIYVVAWVMSAFRPAAGRSVVGLGAAVHLAATFGRGMAIGFFPLTNKLESFSAFALATAAVALLTWRPQRLYVLPLLGFALAGMVTALSFPWGIVYPPPLMQTLWYPLHVPLSFLAYGLWIAAAAAALAWMYDRDRAWLRRMDRLALWGFGLWSTSMVFGGLWGVVAWGAYFMWDPKVVWSVILWFHYATFVHVKYTPSLRQAKWVRPTLALVGLGWVFIAYVGTSFFFGNSSHAF